jgi:hypothetical protein
MRGLWLNKRVYEALPFAYMGVGAGWLVACYYFRDGTAGLAFAVLGLTCLTGGLVVMLKRRGYRTSRSREAFDKTL